MSTDSPSLILISEFIQKHKGLFTGYFIINILTLVVQTIVYSRILSKLFAELSTGKAHPDSIAKLMMFILLASLIIKIGHIITEYLYVEIVPKFNTYVKENLFKGIMERYRIEYQELKLGEVLSNFEKLPVVLHSFTINFLEKFIPILIIMGLCVITLFVMNWRIALASLACLIIVGIGSYLFLVKGIEKSSKSYYQYQGSTNNVQDKLGNLFEIYTSNTEKYEINEYKRLENKLEKSYFESMNFTSFTGIFIKAVSMVFFCINMYILFKAYVKGDMANKDIIFTLIIVGYFNKSLAQISESMMSLIATLGYLLISDDFLEKLSIYKKGKATIAESVESLDNSEPLKGDIVFDNISFKYPLPEKDTKKFTENFSNEVPGDPDSDLNPMYNEHVLKHINFRVNQGSKVTIYGQTGSGKTTLMKILLGFYKIDEGKITIGNKDIKNIELTHLRESISVVNQNIKLFDKSVINNVLYGNRSKYGKSDVIKLMKELKVEHVFGKLKNGLNTKVGINGSKLSGGQKQVVLILRALLKPTHIIILDEPTSALDQSTKTVILDMIHRLNNKTVIIVTHDQDVSKYSDKVYTLKDNQLVLSN